MSGTLVPMCYFPTPRTGVPASTHQNLKILGTEYRENFRIQVRLGSGYRGNIKRWVPLGTGCRPENFFWVPMGTGYRPNLMSTPDPTINTRI